MTIDSGQPYPGANDVPVMINCQWCGELVRQNRVHQKFCCNAHRAAFRNNEIKKKLEGVK